jgi:hypothetical protein
VCSINFKDKEKYHQQYITIMHAWTQKKHADQQLADQCHRTATAVPAFVEYSVFSSVEAHTKKKTLMLLNIDQLSFSTIIFQ